MRFAFTVLLIGTLILSFFTVFHPIETCSATGTTIYVDDGGGANYTNIQDAIDAANEGDTIYVYSGTYSENVVIDKTLTLIGENKANTIISGAVDEADTITVNGILHVNISGFEIENLAAKGNDNPCVYINNGDYCRVTDCIVKNGGFGIWIKNSEECTISGNTIQDNGLAGMSVSIYSNNNNIFSNTFIQNDKGIRIQDNSNNNMIYHNTFQNNDDYNAYDECSNQWDDGSEGNYWDDYNGYDNDSNDIGDTAYDIPGGSNQDRYPLGFFQDENQEPIANAGGPYSANADEDIAFDGSASIDSDGNVVSYRWDWTNDGNYDTSWLPTSTATHSYSNAGSYTVKLEVKDDDGDTDTDTAQVTITSTNQKPTAVIVTASPNSIEYGETVYFHGYGIDTDGMITEYSWRSNRDGVLSTESTFNTPSLTVGLHTIYFKVKDNDGDWSDEVSKNIVVSESSSTNEQPIANAGGPYSGYVNESVIFDGSESSDDGTLTSYSWNFGDGATGTGESSTHIYTSTGNYTITLTVTDNEGATSSDTAYANITMQTSNQNGEDGEDNGIPGFEIILLFVAVIFVLYWKRRCQL